MKNIFKGDKAIWYIFILLLSISLIEVLSAGSYLVMKEGSFTAVIMQQVTFAFISLMAAWSIHFIKCYKYKFLLLFGNFFSILFLIVALVSGQSINNGARWVHIAGISFQPSEIAKGVLIVGTATLIANEYKMGKTSAKSLYITTGLSLITFLFIVTQNLSTALIVFACSYAPFIFFPPPFKAIKKVAMWLLGLGLFGVFCFSLLPKDPDAEIYKNPLMQRVSTWRNRVSGDSFKKTANPNDFEITDRNRQVVNARIAIARSHGLGVRPGRSVQRDYLSAAYSDFIYAIIAEELGLAGCVLVVFLYLFFLYRCIKLAQQSPTIFPAALIMGLSIMIVGQAFVNMAVAVGLGPVTGQTLPLISKGGTSAIITGAYFGMILSCSREIMKRNSERQQLIAEANAQLAAAK